MGQSPICRQQRSCLPWLLSAPSQWCTVLSNPAGVCPSLREYCFRSLRELDNHLRPEASARTLVRYSAPRSFPIHALKHRRVEPFDEVHRCCWRHVSLLCACLRDDNDFADPDLSCLEHTLDGTGNRAVKAITLHTFVDISLSCPYTHLTDHLRKLESAPHHLFSPVLGFLGHELERWTCS